MAVPYGRPYTRPAVRSIISNNRQYDYAHGRPCVYHRSLKIHSMWCKLSKPTYTEVDNSPKSLASSLTGESVLTFSESSSFLIFGVCKTGWPFTSADARTHDSTRQYDACKPTASDITGIRIQLYNNQCTMQTAFVYDLSLRAYAVTSSADGSQVTTTLRHNQCSMCNAMPLQLWQLGNNIRL